MEYLTSNFESIKTVADLDSFLELLSSYLSSEELTSDQKGMLENLHKKGCAKKAKIKHPKKMIKKPLNSVDRGSKNKPITGPRFQTIENKTCKIDTLWQTDLNNFVTPILLIISGILVGYLLWLQSIGLYDSSGFENPKLIAFTGIVMVVGFSVYHSLSQSFLALLCCLYMGIYETYFIASGTFSNEAQIARLSPEISSQEKWHLANINRSKEDYENLKTRYDNPSDKVFQNTWFKKNHLDPAWKKYSTARKIFESFSTNPAINPSGLNHVGWLKILFRLGLVALFMVIVHQTSRRVRLFVH